MTWLKQSTAATIVMGPFVDSTDGVTAETALTISQADIRLTKNGGAFAQTNNVAGATHMENGHYSVPLDTTDTNTLGRLRVAINESGALPVWRDFEVVPANVWDSFFGADRLQVHVDEMTAGIITAAVIATDAVDADALAADAIAEINATVDVALADYDAPTFAELDARTDAIDAALVVIDDFLDTEVAAIKAKTDLIPADPADASDIATSFTTVNGKLDIIDDLLDTEIAAILADTNELQIDWTDGGRLDLLIDAIKVKTDNLPVDPADDGDIDTQLAAIAGFIDTEVASILAAVDTEVAAIKAKTDNLPAAPAATGDVPTAIQNADAVLSRGVSNVENTADTTSLAALILAAFESSIVGSTWTIRKTGGTTFVIKTVTVDSAADPITGVT